MTPESKKDLPLRGRTIMVTRPRQQLHGLADRLKSLGADTLEVPSVEICCPEEWEEVDAAIDVIDSFAWIVFTSANGVNSFMQRVAEVGAEVQDVMSRKLAAIGPATAKAIEKFGRKPDVVPAVFISDEITSLLGPLEGKKVLLPRADIARRDIAYAIEEKGGIAVNVTVYKIKQATDPDIVELIKKSGKVDYITFTSGSTVDATCVLLRKAQRINWMNEVQLVSIGPITAKKLAELGYSPGLVAKTYTSEGIVEIILEEERRKHEQ
jgi:uroporphyrinogen-III synthase